VRNMSTHILKNAEAAFAVLYSRRKLGICNQDFVYTHSKFSAVWLECIWHDIRAMG